ncbi:Flp pilus assembly protein CpaB [Modestobacter lapidis]|nr:Flp pilus assembly protein CpaB [Modestobacter lapidis]
MRLLRRPRSPVHLLRQVAAGLLVGLALALALRPAPSIGPPAVSTVPVLVAATDLPAGTLLAAADLAVAALPAALVPDGASGPGSGVAGRVLAGPLRRGEPVTDVRLVGPAMWAQVPVGEVAAPVRLADLAVAALVRPGDRVDVLSSVPEAGTAEVVAADALVLGAPPGASTDEPFGTAPEGSGLLVLAVSPETARALAAAAATGSLTVTLGPP